MVGDKYTQLAPLARLSPLCPYSGPAVLREVGEVVYSQAENKTNISTILKTIYFDPRKSVFLVFEEKPPPIFFLLVSGLIQL